MSSSGARSLRPSQPGRHRGIAVRHRWRTFLLGLLLMLPLLGGGLGLRLAAWSTSTSTTSGAHVTADYDNKIVLTATNSWTYSFVGSGNKSTN